MHPSVSIIIAAARAADTLPLALDAIDDQDYAGEIEVLVAAADPGTASVATGRATVVENDAGTTPAGLNLAATKSSGDILLRVDAHAIIPSNYVTRVVDLLASTGATSVGGMQVPVGHSLTEKAIAAAMSSPFGAGDATYRIGGEPGPTDTVYLGAFRRADFERMGGYDERYRRHQDYELNHRIISEGGVVWLDPGLAVEYRPRPSLAALANQYFQYGQWKRHFSRSHPGSLRPRHWAAPLLVIGLAASFLGSLWWNWLLALPALYVLGLGVAGLISASKVGPPGLMTPLALAVMHISWGLGFLIGQTSER